MIDSTRCLVLGLVRGWYVLCPLTRVQLLNESPPLSKRSAQDTGLSGASTPDWLTAFGTILAVVAALLISAAGFVSRYYFRPQLEVEFSNAEPFARNAIRVDNGARVGIAYFVRLRIKNKGRRTVARRCEGRIEKLEILSGNDKWDEAKEFDPIRLHWVGQDKTAISINRGAYEYLDILYVDSNAPTFHIFEANSKPRGIVLDWGRGIYKIHFALYWSKSNPIREEWVIVFGDPSSSDVSLQKFDQKGGYEPLPPPNSYQSPSPAGATSGTVASSGASSFSSTQDIPGHGSIEK